MTSTLPHRLPRQRTHEPSRRPTTPYLELDVTPPSTATRARLGTAGHRGALRRQGQPAPAAARRARRSRLPLRRREPGRGARRARRRRTGEQARLLQPGQAPRPHRRGRGARRPALRRRLRWPRPRRSPRPPPAARCCAAWSPPAKVRTGRCPASTAAPPTRPSRSSPSPTSSGSTPPGSPSTSARSSATRRRGQPDRRRRRTSSSCSADEGCTPGCSTWAAASRRRTTTAAGRSRRTARPSTATSTSAFGAHRPQTMIEPGRGIVGDAGNLVSSVIGVVDRGGVRWVYLDAGVFTGLVETLDEAIRYRLSTSADGAPTGPCVLAGPDLRQRRRALRGPDGAAPDRPRRGRRGAAALGRRVHELLLERGVQRVRSPADRGQG